MNSEDNNRGFLDKLDMFGVPVTIRFNKMETHKTKTGALITLMIVSILFFQIYSMIVELINFTNVSVIFQEEIVDLPNKFQIEPNTFNFAFGFLTDDLSYINDKEILSFEAIFQQTLKVFNKTSHQFEFVTKDLPFQMVQCTNDHFQMKGDIHNYFRMLPLQNLFCFDINTKVELEGQFGAAIYKRLRLKVKECVGDNCKDSTQRAQKLNNSQLQIIYINYALQITNLTYPFQEFGSIYFWKYSSNTLKNINLYFRNVYLESTQGIFANDIVKHNRLIYSSDREQNLQKYDDTMFELFINLEKNKESHYYRKYLTLVQAFSQIGGLFNFMICIGALFIRPFSRIVYKQKLLNQIFTFKKSQMQNTQCSQNNQDTNSPNINSQAQNDTTKQQSNNNNNNTQLGQLIRNKYLTSRFNSKSKESLRPISKTNPKDNSPTTEEQIIPKKSLNVRNQQIFSFTERETNEKDRNQKQSIVQQTDQSFHHQANSIEKQNNMMNEQFQKIYDNYLKKQFDKVDDNQYISSFDMMKSHLSSFFKFIPKWKMSPKSKMIQYGLSKLDQHLEINYIIGKLIELEKLKKVVLSNEQISLFNLIPKPNMDELYFRDGKQTSGDIQKTFFFHTESKGLSEKIKDAQIAFNALIKDNLDTSLNSKKLLQLIDSKLLVFLDQNSECSAKLSSINRVSQQQQLQQQQTDQLYLQDIIADEQDGVYFTKLPKPFNTEQNKISLLDIIKCDTLS